MRAVACQRGKEDGGTPLEALEWLAKNVNGSLETKLISPCPDGEEGRGWEVVDGVDIEPWVADCWLSLAWVNVTNYEILDDRILNPGKRLWTRCRDKIEACGLGEVKAACLWSKCSLEIMISNSDELLKRPRRLEVDPEYYRGAYHEAGGDGPAASIVKATAVHCFCLASCYVNENSGLVDGLELCMDAITESDNPEVRVN